MVRAALLIGSAFLVLLVVGAPLAARSAESPSSPALIPTHVEEIQVTARKRTEFLEDTPVSVSVVDESMLRATEVTRLEEIQNLVPNVQISEQFTSTVGAGVAIRGVVTEDPAIALDPGIGIYVDGVYLPRTTGQLMDILDVEQIEVLRGPQGTLFGRSTIGGAINVTTVKPRPELEGFALVRLGNFGRVDTQVMLNLPVRIGWLEDRLFTRFSFGSVQRDGYVYNPFRNEYWSNRNSFSFLGSLRFLPRDDLTIDVSGSWSKSHARERAGQCVVVTETPFGGLVPGFYDACRASEPHRVSADTAAFGDLESYGTWGTVAWTGGELGPLDSLTVRSLTSWREQISRFRMDLDMTEFPFVTSAMGASPATGRPGSQRQISQELKTNASAWNERVQLTGGFYAFWEDATQDGGVQALPSIIGTTQLEITTDNWAWALYGQASVDPVPWLSLTGGIRYTSDQKNVHYLSTPPGGAEPVVDFTGSAVFPSWTPMASIALRAPDDWMDDTSIESFMGYFSCARGFRSGGFDAAASPNPRTPVEFQPETLDSFEIGAKVIGFARRVTLNLSLFYGNYDDVQVYQITSTPTAPVDVAILNAAQATTRGLELELLTIPVEGLQLTGSIGLLDARYDTFEGISDLDGTALDRAGERFQGVPEVESHVGLQYSFPLPLPGPDWLEGYMTPRIDWSYRGSINYLGPEVPSGTQRGYNLLDARLSYDFLHERMQVALWAKNLTDAEYFDFVFPLTTFSGTISRLYQLPRTFGGELSARF